MDSSIIFLALICVWLCYVVPSWLARRHDAHSSRVQDRFSEGIRTLDQRESRRPRSTRGYLLHGGAGHSRHSQRVAGRDGTALHDVTMPRRGSALALASAGVLLVSLVAIPVLLALSGLGKLPWSWTSVPVVLAGASLGLLRVRAVTIRSRAARDLRSASTAGWSMDDAAQAVVPTLATAVADGRGAPALPVTVLYDEVAITAVERAEAVAAARAAAEAKAARRAELEANLQPGEWLPVEVPKPTYLSKPVAPRRPPTPQRQAEHVVLPGDLGLPDEIVLTDETVLDVRESRGGLRRAAGQ